MSHWNHRVLAHKYNDEVVFEIHEVYYDDNGVPNGYCSTRVSGDSIKGIKWTLNRMKDCLKRPILWGGDKFPEEYIE